MTKLFKNEYIIRAGKGGGHVPPPPPPIRLCHGTFTFFETLDIYVRRERKPLTNKCGLNKHWAQPAPTPSGRSAHHSVTGTGDAKSQREARLWRRSNLPMAAASLSHVPRSPPPPALTPGTWVSEQATRIRRPDPQWTGPYLSTATPSGTGNNGH